MRASSRQSGQAMVLVAFALLALIGSAALVLLAGSFEWQRNQLQQVADQAALDSALKVGVGCSAGSASTVITEADNFVATQRTRSGSLSIAAGTCATPYTGTDTFAGGLSETIHYPYRAHQQQVEVILTLSLPISFGGELGATNTTVTRRAVAQQLSGSVPAVSATTLSCTSGQVNIAGSVAAQNLITRGGTCAFYAHQRFDAASGTYSDFGNVSVYTDGQTWTAPGTCAALLNTGSSSAICADGYELSGHNAPACAAGTTSFLSGGDAAVNSNPCAAGVARPPAASVSVNLPPEPNTDRFATATLPGGTPCSSGAAYPAFIVAGAKVGSAEATTPAPVKDAGGFYHFKPSCYGYLDLTTFKAAGIANRQIGARVGPVRHFVTPTIPLGSKAASLLVATINVANTPNSLTAPANWVQAAQVDQAGAGPTQIWYLPVAFNLGGITQAQFTVLPASRAFAADAQLSEWTGAAALDQTGAATFANAASATVSTTGATTQAGELVITADGFSKRVARQTFTKGAGWTAATADPAHGFASEYRVNLPAGVESETVTAARPTAWALAIATFKAAAANVGVVFDPGFYYFNGSGLGGGGGICLNGAELLGQDVTLEFVNQAGLSSGNCAVGGATVCSGSDCDFGSAPCSISACPPNTTEDSSSGGGYTWFAAPCSSAPAGDGSCRGSAWCPSGDRACWNLLVWAASTDTGQIAIKGTNANAWLLGSLYWPGTCTDTVNGSSTLAGSISCGTLSMSAAAGAGTAVGSDYGVGTALVEAVLVE
ncbi:MAG TPA: hypothetical protein VJT78_08040 [Candidatus Dormibacteraeota bacterium]|nr:hypothetical protein [Candidatus Dormibacteraeota bacterium]